MHKHTQSYRLLEWIAVCGELPFLNLDLLPVKPDYLSKLLTALKREGWIRCIYKDKLRSYRLTKKAKMLLLKNDPKRFAFYLTGNVDTNLCRREISRRLRLQHTAQAKLMQLRAGICLFRDQKAGIFEQTYQGRDNLSFPVYYDSREIREMEIGHMIGNSRATGILITSDAVYVVYNTGSGILKWMPAAEKRLKAQLEYLLQYSGRTHELKNHEFRGLMFGDTMKEAYRLMESQGGRKDNWFCPDNIFTAFHFIPLNSCGVKMLKRLCDQVKRPFHDTWKLGFYHNSLQPLDARDFDMVKIRQYREWIEDYGASGKILCYDFQKPEPGSNWNNGLKWVSEYEKE